MYDRRILPVKYIIDLRNSICIFLSMITKQTWIDDKHPSTCSIHTECDYNVYLPSIPSAHMPPQLTYKTY